MMKAALYRQVGPAREVLSLSEVETPAIGPDEVLVKLAYSGVNPADVKVRGGVFPRYTDDEFTIPHSDGGGVIEAMGEAVGAAASGTGGRLAVGQRVAVMNGQWGRACGTAAEYISIPAKYAVPIPDKVGLDHAACFGIPLFTAYRAVTIAGDVAGKDVFVAGGAGAVGHYAIQIAKAKGARVVTTVSSAAKAKVARAAGADRVIDYRAENVAEQVAAWTNDRGVDHYIEVNLSANGSSLVDCLANGASVAVYGSDEGAASVPAIAMIVKQVRIYFFLVYLLSDEDLATAKRDLYTLLDAGKLQTPIAETFPLEEIAEAHEAQERGVIGNLVVRVADI